MGTVSKSVLASKTFWTCVLGALAEIATASGLHILDDQAMQAQIVGLLTAGFAGLFRITATQEVHVLPPAAVVLLALGLTGCAGVTAAVPVLSEAATVACAGQQAANLAGDLATRLGSVRGAAAASETSTILGLACTWL